MIKIRTKAPVLFDARHQYTSVIEIEITKFQELSNGIMTDVVDYWFKDVEITVGGGELQTIPQRTHFKTSSLFIITDQIDAIASAISGYLSTELTESQRREAIKRFALLHYVKNDRLVSDNTRCIYNTLPDDWELVLE